MSNKEVIIIGAGPSGICAAVQLQRLLGHQNFHVYERSTGLGGVWFNNTYPGCAVDIPAHYYSYSFAMKPDWPKLYPGQQDLYNYFHDVCEEYDILRRVSFNTECIAMSWDEDRSLWTVSFHQTDDPSKTFTCEASAVVCAVGKLDLPSMPTVAEGLRMLYSTINDPLPSSFYGFTPGESRLATLVGALLTPNSRNEDMENWVPVFPTLSYNMLAENRRVEANFGGAGESPNSFSPSMIYAGSISEALSGSGASESQTNALIQSRSLHSKLTPDLEMKLVQNYLSQ